jgi:hypothetical protein
MSAYAALTPITRQRLDRFAAGFDRLDPADYRHYTASAPAGIEAVERKAWKLFTSAERDDAAAAVQAFEEAATNNAIERAGFRAAVAYLPRDSFVWTPADHQLLVANLRRAVLALIAEDRLARDAFERLLGPWSRLTDEAGLTSPD